LIYQTISTRTPVPDNPLAHLGHVPSTTQCQISSCFISGNTNQYVLHPLHPYLNELPCISDILCVGTPDRRCNPSPFVLTMNLHFPLPTRAANAMWDFVGTTLLRDVPRGAGSPLDFFVQIP